jgi:hypothetical protein
MVIRSTVKPREKSPEEGSEDRRPATPRATPPATRETPAPAPQPQPQPVVPTTLAIPVRADADVDDDAEARADAANDVDGCDVTEAAPATLDENLPPTRGGVG